jgi:hypothetical protein
MHDCCWLAYNQPRDPGWQQQDLIHRLAATNTP